MKFVIQKVSHACVRVEDEIVGSISKGFLVFVGVGQDDTPELADKFVKKMTALRIFRDEQGKTNLSLKDVNGQVLIISQFTLYADCRKGNRPSFVKAGDPEKAEALYRHIIDKTKESVDVVEEGVFGAYMKVELENDGPFTVILDETSIH